MIYNILMIQGLGEYCYRNPLCREVAKIILVIMIISGIGGMVGSGMGWLPNYVIYTSSAMVILSLIGLFVACNIPTLENYGVTRDNLVVEHRPNDLLIPFYTGVGQDSEGRTFEQILEFSDERLEECHNYIQWLFPLAERSNFNQNAPVLGEIEIQNMRNNNRVIENMKRAFNRMLRFYGLRYVENENRIERADDWGARSPVWLTRGNHNFLRITRILTCLRSMGLEQEMRAFYAQLHIIAQEENSPVGNSLNYWTRAVN